MTMYRTLSVFLAASLMLCAPVSAAPSKDVATADSNAARTSISGFRLGGAQSVSAPDLESRLSSLIGRPADAAGLAEAKRAVLERYRARGVAAWIGAVSVNPANGVVTIEIVEGLQKIQAIRVAGSVRIPAETLESSVAEYIGRTGDAATLNEIAAKITHFYRTRGYPAAYATFQTFPGAPIRGGTVFIEIVKLAPGAPAPRPLSDAELSAP
ncbi:hypothetical protein GCM10025771_40010 [Niveibacterium umoris]|uniref:Hemolysin activation/secretion protein n=1 Tax=Niveibacterium umoris TaxID=1193620 RepID=A0A840BJR6_9RHOO|nr:POTRA domain-containing protein [Niveibacterium umoris]MBB4010797.1 hemolysin activation/secretion protein [Niveibacterium umoris]